MHELVILWNYKAVYNPERLYRKLQLKGAHTSSRHKNTLTTNRRLVPTVAAPAPVCARFSPTLLSEWNPQTKLTQVSRVERGQYIPQWGGREGCDSGKSLGWLVRGVCEGGGMEGHVTLEVLGGARVCPAAVGWLTCSNKPATLLPSQSREKETGCAKDGLPLLRAIHLSLMAFLCFCERALTATV